jgi:succinylglutamate desuccinylase
VAPGNESGARRELEGASRPSLPPRIARAGSRQHLDLHTAIRGSRYRQFALLPAREGEYDAGFYALLQASDMDAIVRHTEPGGTFTHYTSEKFGAQSATLELGR